MSEPRRLTTLWAFTACYRDGFTLHFTHKYVLKSKWRRIRSRDLFHVPSWNWADMHEQISVSSPGFQSDTWDTIQTGYRWDKQLGSTTVLWLCTFSLFSQTDHRLVHAQAPSNLSFFNRHIRSTTILLNKELLPLLVVIQPATHRITHALRFSEWITKQYSKWYIVVRTEN
jgi:hypothetical protein